MAIISSEMNKISKVLVSFTLLLIFSGCAPPVRYFDLTKENFEPKGRTIAVLAGLNNELSAFFAARVTESLARHSTFRVLSQREIAQAIPAYPLDIQGPYSSAYFDIEEDLTKTDVQRIKNIGRKLGTNYLFVIWVPTTYLSHDKTIYNILEISLLFELPSAEVVGRSGLRIPVTKVERSGCFCISPSYNAPNAQDISDRITREADEMTKEIAEQTRMALTTQGR